MIVLTIPMMFAISQVNAQQQQVDTYLYVYASPNPVGVGQTEYLSLFFTKPLPPAFGQMFGGGVYHGLTVKVNKPDGTTQNFGPYTTDTTGGVGGIQFVPNVVGNYTAQAFYPGENMTGTDTIFLLEPNSDIYGSRRIDTDLFQPSLADGILVSPNLRNELWMG